jgi:hypothetical protein
LLFVRRIDGEEAKMIAWDSMQKAKAEAAIWKLVLCLSLVSRFSFSSFFMLHSCFLFLADRRFDIHSYM